MKTNTLKLIPFFTLILAGCAGPQPRTNLTSANNIGTNSKQIETPLLPQPKMSGARVYPYKTKNAAVVAMPIVIEVQSLPTPKVIAPKTNIIKKTETTTVKTKVSNSATNARKTNVTPKPRSKSQPIKPTIKLASVAKIQPVIKKPVTPVAALLRQAENQRTTGDLVKAAATLERGVRIEPRNPNLWNKLARIRLEQGLFGQAQNMAAKSNTMANGSPQIIQENQRIISEASKKAGH